MTTPRLFLSTGNHRTLEHGACAMEWTAWVAGEAHNDHPQCVSPVIGAFMRRLNDRLEDGPRQTLVPVLLDCIGTNTGRADDITRAFLCADWAIHVAAPFVLRARGFAEHAAKLEACAPVVDIASARLARDVARNATSYAAAAAYAADAAAYAAYAAYAAAAAAAYAAYAADAAAAYAADAAADAAAADAAAYAADAAAAAAELLHSALDLVRRMCAVGQRVPVVCDVERVAVLA